MFKFGTNEVVVGRGAVANFQGLTVGSTIHSGQNTWQVVGMFETDGSIAETEIWCDSRVLQGAYRRGNTYQTLLARWTRARASIPSAMADANPQVNVQVRRETEYYAQQSRAAQHADSHGRLRHRRVDGHWRGASAPS
jgi:putative ABC transport system permease protein